MSEWGRVDLLRRDLLNAEGDGQPRAWLRKDDVAALLQERDEFARRLRLDDSAGSNAAGAAAPGFESPATESLKAAGLGAAAAAAVVQRIHDLVEECADDFHVCPACGFKDPEATRESNLFLLLKTALQRGSGGEGVGGNEPWRCAALTRSDSDPSRVCSWPACGCDPAAFSAVESLRKLNQDPAAVPAPPAQP